LQPDWGRKTGVVPLAKEIQARAAHTIEQVRCSSMPTMPQSVGFRSEEM
jgi:hypothetical protein